MKTKLILSVTAAALVAVSPASAQLLGGGRLGGGLGGGLGGTLGGLGGRTIGTGPSTIGRTPLDSDTLGSATGSVRGHKKIDRRTGQVNAGGDAAGSGALANTTNLAGRPLSGSANGLGNAAGNADAQLVGTNQVRDGASAGRSAASGALGRGASTAQGTATGAATRARGAADEARGDANTSGSGAGALGLSGSRSLDTRSGQVSGSGNASGSGALDRGVALGGRSLNGGASGSGDAAGSGSAQLVGTNALATSATQAASTARNGAARGRNALGNTIGQARGLASGGGGATTSAGGSGSATASDGYDGGAASLAGSGSGNGSGGFNVAPGMPVSDARGRVIGRVQAVQRTASGALSQIVVRAGKRIATLPANSFSANGDLLVSSMSKSEIDQAAQGQTSPN